MVQTTKMYSKEELESIAAEDQARFRDLIKRGMLSGEELKDAIKLLVQLDNTQEDYELLMILCKGHDSSEIRLVATTAFYIVGNKLNMDVEDTLRCVADEDESMAVSVNAMSLLDQGKGDE